MAPSPLGLRYFSPIEGAGGGDLPRLFPLAPARSGSRETAELCRDENDRWWFRGAAGERFVSLGINHVQSDCWLAPYNRAYMLDRYGADLEGPDGRFNGDGEGLRRLLAQVKEELRGLGFNTFGMHTYDVPPELYGDEFYYCAAIDFFPLGSRYKFKQQRFPDIFAGEFRQKLEAHIAACCALHRDRKQFLGYAYSDIPRWYFYEGQSRDREPVHPWVRDLLSLPDGAPGREACRAVVGDADVATREQSDAILRRVVEFWYKLHARLIRKHDPRHLLFGDKLHSPHRIPEWFLPILRENVDLLFLQWYCPIEDQEATLRKLHAATGKPILNGDSCFSCPKPPRQTKVKGYKVPSQAAVGEAYAAYLEGAMRLPFMLGWHHCGLLEQWDGGKQNDWEINENGLFDPFEKPYPEITAAVKRANRQAARWHKESG